MNSKSVNCEQNNGTLVQIYANNKNEIKKMLYKLYIFEVPNLKFFIPRSELLTGKVKKKTTEE